jgi:hypothetical protein
MLNMESPEEQLESLSRRIEERERLSRRRAWLLAGIPILFAALFLAYTVWQIAQAQTKLAATNDQLARVEKAYAGLQTKMPQAQTALAVAQAEIAQASDSLATATAQVGEAMSELNRVQAFSEYACGIDATVLKEYSGSATLQSRVLLFLQESLYGNIPWNPGGFSEFDGFDSPNFALYVLQIHGLASPDILPGIRPWEFLPAASVPENGDIVYYESGYTMFYYKLPSQYEGTEMRECVIGMTPLRVKSLDVMFARQIGVLKVAYP